MFAGGLTVAAPSFMPGAYADFSETDGMLTVSSVYIQGGAILEVVVNDPDFSATDSDIANGPTVTIGGTSYITNQAANGKWYVYAVDDSVSTLLDADAKGMEYGYQCTTGLGINTGASQTSTQVRGTANVIGDTSYDLWAEALATSGTTASSNGGCLDINNMIASLDATAGTTSRQTLSASVLQGAPSLSNWNGAAANATTIDLGQRGHSLNASGYGSWPYILAFEFGSDNLVEYGSDAINVEFGNTDSQTAIEVINNSPSDMTNIHLTITDPALNIDPTTADKWEFNLQSPDSSDHQLKFSSNETDTNGGNLYISLAEMGDMSCGSNCRLANSTGSANTIITGGDTVIMTESGPNTAFFESWSTNGTSQIVTVDEIGGDKKVVFTYGGNSADMIITYNNADLTFDAGDGDWVAGETAYVTVNDPDANKYPSVAETLSISDETVVIPTIKMGSPLTLANSDGNVKLTAGTANANAGVQVGTGTGTPSYTLQVNNTTDNSERLRITHSAEASATHCATAPCIGGSMASHTWINVTTAHDRSSLIDLPGTVVLNYDVSGPASDLSSTAVAVYVTDSGENSTNNANGLISALTSGNARSGVIDLDDDTYWIKSTDVTNEQSFTSQSEGEAGTVNVGVAFKITHPIGTFLNTTADYAIAADFCNFDQDNGSNVHNCIYRIEAEETGDNTGVFEGTVDYVMLNNSTAASSDNSEHDGNDEEVEGLLTTNSDGVTVVLMNGVTGSDTIRVVYNDTDALQAAAKIGSQIDTLTHSGTADLDADSYGAADMATITIVDADLNQDSGVRDTYENSSRTFQMNVTGSAGTAHMPFETKPMTIIETTNDSGIFVGTFKVPDYKGQDMSLTYYDSKDASGSAVEVYADATVVSNSGTVSFDRSVYPVPFAANDLRTGANAETGQSEAGNVTMTISVSDADFTDDTLTTSSASVPGTILVKLISGSTTSTCFTAGSAASATLHKSSSTVQELGPLSETELGSQEYTVEFSVDEVLHCGTMQTITSGDVFQVEYVDTADDAGTSSTSYDSSTFDLRTGSLSVDKDVYVLGSDVVITLTDPDLN
ncbi:hypothetical protein CL635_01315, partial [bacterium]|nr:hypothetical protein [bacterium]